jgi:hypothetical protein
MATKMNALEALNTLRALNATNSYVDVISYLIAKNGRIALNLGEMELQFFLYYCQAWHLALKDKPLFKENLWTGLLSSRVKEFSEHMNKFHESDSCSVNEKRAYKFLYKLGCYGNNLNNSQKEFVDEVFRKYYNCEQSFLNIFHLPGDLWYSEHQKTKKISTKELKKFYKHYSTHCLYCGQLLVKEREKMNYKGLAKKIDKDINVLNIIIDNLSDEERYKLWEYVWNNAKQFENIRAQKTENIVEMYYLCSNVNNKKICIAIRCKDEEN